MVAYTTCKYLKLTSSVVLEQSVVRKFSGKANNQFLAKLEQ